MTFSHLRVGTKPFRSKPPRKGPPCVEPYVQGTNILRDPGFELHLANLTGGPFGEEIPGKKWMDVTTPTTQYTSWSDGSLAPITSGWTGEVNYIAQTSWIRAGWTVSTSNLRSGTYHARTTPIVGNGLVQNGNPGALYPTGFHACSNNYPWAARVEPGDFVSFSMWASMTPVLGNSNPELIVFQLDFYDIDASWIASVDGLPGGNEAITTSYAQFTVSGFAPAAAYYLDVQPTFDRDGGDSPASSLVFDVDDCILEVT